MKINTSSVQTHLYNNPLHNDPVANRQSANNFAVNYTRAQVGSDNTTKVSGQPIQGFLTPGEQKTLEALFGASENARPEFYGQNRISTLFKGQLLDIKG